jgi:hypothetical protein
MGRGVRTPFCGRVVVVQWQAGEMALVPKGATSNRAAGRPACFSYNCCGAGSESDTEQRREAIWLS